MPQDRLQKLIAQSGVASRRKAEELITEGRVRVNGKVVTALGTKADLSRDRVEVDGKSLSFEKQVTLLMNKPRGVVCTSSDPEGRATVLELVKGLSERLYPVGRLDFATSGALLLTNDGALSYALTHPKHSVEKVYLLKISGPVLETVLEEWRQGVDIGDVTRTRPAEVFRVEEEENYTWIEVTIREGRNRQIRRMAEATGLVVIKLKRVAFAGLTIEGIKVGEYRVLGEKELLKLRQHYHIPSPTSPSRGKAVNRPPWAPKPDDDETQEQQPKKRSFRNIRPQKTGEKTGDKRPAPSSPARGRKSKSKSPTREPAFKKKRGRNPV